MKRGAEIQLGPGEYNSVKALEFVRNAHSFNITNNILYGEMDRIKGKPYEEKKQAAISLYKSPVFATVLSQYSNASAFSMRMAKKNPKKLIVRSKYRSGRKTATARRTMTEPMLTHTEAARYGNAMTVGVI